MKLSFLGFFAVLSLSVAANARSLRTMSLECSLGRGSEVIRATMLSQKYITRWVMFEAGAGDKLEFRARGEAVTGTTAPKSEGKNVFTFDLDGHGSERALYLPDDVAEKLGERSFRVTGMIYEDGVSPRKANYTCTLK